MSLMKLESIHAYRVHDVPSQIRRKIGLNSSQSALDDVAERVAQEGNAASQDQGFRSILAEIATYDSTETGFEVPIINVGADDDISYFNEGSQIYNFVAVVTLDPLNQTRSTEQRVIVVGYTSECEPSFGGYLPPDTKLYINDIYGLTVSYHTAPNGQRYTTDNSFRITDNHVLANALPAQTFGEAESYVLPDNMMSIADHRSSYDVGSGEELVLHTAQFRQTPQCVTSDMVSPDQFVSKATEGFLYGLHTVSEHTPEYSDFSHTVSSQTSSFFQQRHLTRSLGNNPFVSRLRDHLASKGFTGQGNNIKSSGCFTLRDLSECLGNPQDLDTQLANSVMQSESDLGPTYGADDWDSNTMASIVSYDIANRLSPIMAKHLVGQITFSFSTMDYVDGMLGRAMIVPESVLTLDRHGKVPSSLLYSFRDTLEYSLINVVTKGNRVPVKATVMAALGSAIRVELQIDGAPAPEAFTYASFMSGRLNTTTTTDNQYVQNLAGSLNSFTKALKTGFEEYQNGQAKGSIFSDDLSDKPTDNLFGNDNDDSLFGGGNQQDDGDLFGGGNNFKF
tara:strand:- start:20668 stop:22359 length:1692 start_codon:yes stop_codon:yes gene_type:complete